MNDQVKELKDAILTKFNRDRANVIPILQNVQGKWGYLSKESIYQISRFLGVTENDVFGVATFYAQFRFTPPGDHIVKVCLGTACHVKGGEKILEAVERELDVKRGGTTMDYKFSLETVACFGCCALAPVIVKDTTVYSKMTPPKARKVLKEVEEGVEEKEVEEEESKSVE